jgi:hypothetical protein
MTEKEKQLLDFLRVNPNAGERAILQGIGMKSKSQFRKMISNLIKDGIIEKSSMERKPFKIL